MTQPMHSAEQRAAEVEFEMLTLTGVSPDTELWTAVLQGTPAEATLAAAAHAGLHTGNVSFRELQDSSGPRGRALLHTALMQVFSADTWPNCRQLPRLLPRMVEDQAAVIERDLEQGAHLYSAAARDLLRRFRPALRRQNDAVRLGLLGALISELKPGVDPQAHTEPFEILAEMLEEIAHHTDQPYREAINRTYLLAKRLMLPAGTAEGRRAQAQLCAWLAAKLNIDRENR